MIARPIYIYIYICAPSSSISTTYAHKNNVLQFQRGLFVFGRQVCFITNSINNTVEIATCYKYTHTWFRNWIARWVTEPTKTMAAHHSKHDPMYPNTPSQAWRARNRNSRPPSTHANVLTTSQLHSSFFHSLLKHYLHFSTSKVLSDDRY